MSSGDLNYAVKAIVKRIKEGGRDEVLSRDIHMIVVGELICEGFYDVAKACLLYTSTKNMEMKNLKWKLW